MQPRIWMGAVLFAAPLWAGAQALDGTALAQKNRCLACHQVDAKRVGPSFRAVAERFAGKGEDAATRDYLAQSIRKGGRARWGAVPMPAQPHVSEQDAHDLARWILALPPPG